MISFDRCLSDFRSRERHRVELTRGVILRLVDEMWRVLQPGGIFFARLASSIGIENQIEQIEGRRYHLPDGSDRFLVDEQMLLRATESLGGRWLEPLKTVVVQNMRSMSNWCLRKGSG